MSIVVGVPKKIWDRDPDTGHVTVYHYELVCPLCVTPIRSTTRDGVWRATIVHAFAHRSSPATS